MTTRHLVPVAALAVAAALVLTGCGGDDDAEPKAAASTSAAAFPSPSAVQTVQADGDEAQIKITHEDGTTTVGKDLPDGFPGDEIPLVDGKVIGSTQGEKGGPYAYTVLLQVNGGTPASVMAEASRALTAAGFTATPGMSVPEMSTSVFRSAAYEVGVNAVKADYKVTVTYVVRNR